MAFTRVAALLHAALSDVTTAQHHTLYTNAEAVAAVEAAATLTIQGQLAFPASQSPSADANTLDDYEEGTFTPTIADASFDGTGEGQVYSIQVGTYVKIGRMVFFALRVAISDLGSLTAGNNAHILGLPFSSTNLAQSDHSVHVGFGSSLAIPNASENPSGLVGVDSARIFLRLWDAVVGVTSLLISELSVGGDIAVAGHYRV